MRGVALRSVVARPTTMLRVAFGDRREALLRNLKIAGICPKTDQSADN
jgi:hypothetical protein